MTVAVVDEGGLLKALGRMDGAPPLSAQIAEAKAVGAALWHRDGDELAAVQDSRAAFFDQVSSLVRVPLIPADGSVVVRDGDAVLGAVGVSGAKPEEDRACAEAGLRRGSRLKLSRGGADQRLGLLATAFAPPPPPRWKLPRRAGPFYAPIGRELFRVGERPAAQLAGRQTS